MNKDSSAQAAPDVDAQTGQPAEEAEDNLSRHSTKDSSPPVGAEKRTTVGQIPRRTGGSSPGSLDLD
jgi:hypothetical protein